MAADGTRGGLLLDVAALLLSWAESNECGLNAYGRLLKQGLSVLPRVVCLRTRGDLHSRMTTDSPLCRHHHGDRFVVFSVILEDGFATR